MSHEAHRRRRIRRRDLHIVMCVRRWCVSRRAGVRRSPIASAARSCWQGPGKQGAGPGRSCRPGAERPRTGHRTARGSMLATPTHEPTLDALTSNVPSRTPRDRSNECGDGLRAAAGTRRANLRRLDSPLHSPVPAGYVMLFHRLKSRVELQRRARTGKPGPQPARAPLGAADRRCSCEY